VIRLFEITAFCFFLLLFSGNGLTEDQSTEEAHMADPHASPLYSASIFLHGYIHGYEEGFHNADVDIQMAHGFRDVSTMPDYKKLVGYRAAFGDKSVFEKGFRQGFRVGYTDGMSGRSFRAIGVLRSAAEGLSPDSLNPRKIASFEMGVQQGYQAGQSAGLHDGRTAASFRNPIPGCTALDGNASAAKDEAYCDGFRRAFTIGYSDGYTNQQENPHVAVK
jgi:hypothetical protein